MESETESVEDEESQGKHQIIDKIVHKLTELNEIYDILSKKVKSCRKVACLIHLNQDVIFSCLLD